MKNFKVAAIVPVREGSRRLKNKNSMPWAETNLTLNKLKILKRVAEIDQIVLTSDSDELLRFGLDEGVITNKRPKEYCDEKSKSFSEVVSYVVSQVDADIIVWATVTAPLLESSDYSEALDLFMQHVVLKKTHDSVVTVEPFKRYLWDSTKPINYKLGSGHVPSQELDELFFITDGILIAKKVDMLKWSYFHGPNPYLMRLPKLKCVDIDDELDYLQALSWRKKFLK